jgi:hypothetical protein
MAGGLWGLELCRLVRGVNFEEPRGDGGGLMAIRNGGCGQQIWIEAMSSGFIVAVLA